MWINHVNVTSKAKREMRWIDHFKQNISTIVRVSRIWKRGERDVIITSHEKTVKFVIIFYVNMHGKYACWLVYKKIYIVMRHICLLPKVATLRAFTPTPFNCPRCLMDRMIASRTVDRGIDTWKCQTKIYWISIFCFCSEYAVLMSITGWLVVSIMFPSRWVEWHVYLWSVGSVSWY